MRKEAFLAMNELNAVSSNTTIVNQWPRQGY